MRASQSRSREVMGSGWTLKVGEKVEALKNGRLVEGRGRRPDLACTSESGGFRVRRRFGVTWSSVVRGPDPPPWAVPVDVDTIVIMANTEEAIDKPEQKAEEPARGTGGKSTVAEPPPVCPQPHHPARQASGCRASGCRRRSSR